jgi:ribonuclease D
VEIKLYKNDLPEGFLESLRGSVAIDTETMGLSPYRDRLCLVQFSLGNEECHLVQYDDFSKALNIKRLLADESILKIFHYARFDVMMLFKYLEVMTKNIYCTKIASKLVRTYASSHSLLELCRDLLRCEISKEQTCSDWGNAELTNEQKQYAATDVLYLHKLKEKLDVMLKREGREEIAQACFDFLQTRVKLDLTAGENYDIFSHGC